MSVKSSSSWYGKCRSGMNVKKKVERWWRSQKVEWLRKDKFYRNNFCIRAIPKLVAIQISWLLKHKLYSGVCIFCGCKSSNIFIVFCWRHTFISTKRMWNCKLRNTTCVVCRYLRYIFVTFSINSARCQPLCTNFLFTKKYWWYACLKSNREWLVRSYCYRLDLPTCSGHVAVFVVRSHAIAFEWHRIWIYTTP